MAIYRYYIRDFFLSRIKIWSSPFGMELCGLVIFKMWSPWVIFIMWWVLQHYNIFFYLTCWMSLMDSLLEFKIYVFAWFDWWSNLYSRTFVHAPSTNYTRRNMIPLGKFSWWKQRAIKLLISKILKMQCWVEIRRSNFF